MSKKESENLHTGINNETAHLDVNCEKFKTRVISPFLTRKYNQSSCGAYDIPQDQRDQATAKDDVSKPYFTLYRICEVIKCLIDFCGGLVGGPIQGLPPQPIDSRSIGGNYPTSSNLNIIKSSLQSLLSGLETIAPKLTLTENIDNLIRDFSEIAGKIKNLEESIRDYQIQRDNQSRIGIDPKWMLISPDAEKLKRELEILMKLREKALEEIKIINNVFESGEKTKRLKSLVDLSMEMLNQLSELLQK